MSTPNRLESHWKQLKPLLLEKWDRLTEADLEYIDAEFDRLVDVVKQRYDGPVKTVPEEMIRYEALMMLKGIER